MYIYDQIFEEPFYSSGSFDFYYKDSRVIGEANAAIGVFDIETTGLNPANGQVIMGALLNKVDGGLRVRQFFTDGDGEEEELLLLYKEALDEMDVLVSYNGNGFDFPYLKKRLDRFGLDSSFSKIMSLDMFKVLHKHSNLRDIIPNLKQKTVEEYMGLGDSRDDLIDGGKSVELYFRYLENNSDELRDIMLLHNRDDVLQLSRILWVFDKLNIHKIASYTGFPVMAQDHTQDDPCEFLDKKMIVKDIRLKTKRLDINGFYGGINGRYHLFRDDCTVVLNPRYEQNLLEPESDFGQFEINIPMRYEQKVTFVTGEDIHVDEEFWNEPVIGGKDYVILKKDGNTDNMALNLLIKYVVRDILKDL